MKKLITIFCGIIIFVSLSSDSFSVPLNGTYTIGSGGHYATISSAVNDVVSQGVSGPVVFNILTGTYNEYVGIDSIPGTSIINTVTFKSQTGNYVDVIFQNKLVLNGADNVIIESMSFLISLSFDGQISLRSFCDNIRISRSSFKKIPFSSNSAAYIAASGRINNLCIEENIFELITWQVRLEPAVFSSNVRIINNTFIGGVLTNIFYAQSLIAQNCNYIVIEKNNFFIKFACEGLQLENCNSFKISKNNFSGPGYSMFLNSCGNTITNSIISNNFFSTYSLPSSLVNCNNILCINNSWSINGISISSSNSITLINNLFIKATLNFTNCNNLNSDYNNFYEFAIGYNGINYNSVPDFYNATGLEQHSTTHFVNFIDSLSDLHLTGSSIGDEELIGIPSSFVTDDIDGQPRNSLYPYKGADEADFPLPVELSSFTSTVDANNVKLNWTTSMENNNSGFDIEKSNVKGQTSDDWMKIGFIHGNGTTNSSTNYEFIDKGLPAGKYKYRLKQIDFNGNFEYYELSNEVLIGVPEKFSLSQNYPNPFNPVTKIKFDLPSIVNSELSIVNLTIFDVLGKEVTTLVNDKLSAGSYEVEFNGSNFSSGIYFYKLETENFRETKGMILLK